MKHSSNKSDEKHMKHSSNKNDEDSEMGWVIKEPWADWPEEEQLECFRLEQQGTQRAREEEAKEQEARKRQRFLEKLGLQDMCKNIDGRH